MPEPINELLATPIQDEHEEERLGRYLKELQEDADTYWEQRDKANEDMRFVTVSGGHWEGFLEDEYSDRAKLQLDVTSPYINRFIAEYNATRVGIEYKPNNDSTSDDDAELLTGKRLSDFRDFAGKLSQDNAVDEVSKTGYGCYKLAAEYEDPEDPENENQVIVFRPIYSAYNSVVWDRASKWIDKRDATRCVELVEYTLPDFKKIFPDKAPVSAYVPEDYRGSMYDGYGNQDTIFVACRYDIVIASETVHVYRNLRTEQIEVYSDEDHAKVKDELAEDELVQFVRSRVLKRRRVTKTVFSGKEILKDTKRIVGKYIPIIPMYGFRGFCDGVEWFKGLVRDLKDPQRLFNMQVSQLAESAAGQGQEKPIFDPSQMPKNISDLWKDVHRLPYLLAKSMRDKEGKIIHSGPIGYLKPAQLDGAIVQLMQLIPAYIQERTGGAPQETMDPKSSGKAIKALMARENQNTQDIRDNIANAIEWEGVVYASMAEEVYRGERTVTVRTPEGTEFRRNLNRRVFDEETGRTIVTDVLEGKRFKAYADTGPQYETAKEQMVEELKAMLEAIKDLPMGAKYGPAIVALILQNVSGPGKKPLDKMIRQDLLLQGLIDPETDEDKEFLQKAAAQEGNAQSKLMEAAAQQAAAEGRERDSKTLVNAADANKKQAETQKILEDLKREGVNTLLAVRKAVLENTEKLPLN